MEPDSTDRQYNDGLSIDYLNQRAQVHGEHVALTNKEWALLILLASHPGRVFTKAELYEHVWSQPEAGNSSTVTVHVKSLRAKLGDEPHHPRWIQTVWGSGYRFVGSLRNEVEVLVNACLPHCNAVACRCWVGAVLPV